MLRQVKVVLIGCRVDRTFAEKFKLYAQQKGEFGSTIVRKALVEYMENNPVNNKKDKE